MQPDNEDEAWRAIVENYGERPTVDPDEPPEDVDEERFVPPPPPPVPRTSPDRLAAWGGLFGAPLVLLVVLLLGRSLPAWLGYVLVAWFVGGFLYLVVQMPSGPRDPGDDGARL